MNPTGLFHIFHFPFSIFHFSFFMKVFELGYPFLWKGEEKFSLPKAS